jgi:hypothetical protein
MAHREVCKKDIEGIARMFRAIESRAGERVGRASFEAVAILIDLLEEIAQTIRDKLPRVASISQGGPGYVSISEDRDAPAWHCIGLTLSRKGGSQRLLWAGMAFPGKEAYARRYPAQVMVYSHIRQVYYSHKRGISYFCSKKTGRLDTQKLERFISSHLVKWGRHL